MTDINSYLTDDMIRVALRASDSADEGGVVGGRERKMRAALAAVLPDIIQQAWNGPNVSASTGTHAAIVAHRLTDLSRKDRP